MPHGLRDIDLGKDCPPAIGTRYVIKKELGRGSYGTVYMAIDTVTNKSVAIKRIEDVFRSYTDAKRTLREISIMRNCNHTNITRLLDILQSTQTMNYNDLWIVIEYGGWDLLKILKNYRKINGWCSKYVKYIIYQLLCAINYLDSAHIVHRDLKPSNLLMNEKCDLKLIDFGLSTQILNTKDIDLLKKEIRSESVEIIQETLPKRQLTRHVVTRWYRAPELILLQDDYNSEIDVWSVGCIMAELLQTLEPSTVKPQPLFPGTTCFPLSSKPNERHKYEKLEQEFRQETHELLKIFAVIGSPSDEEIDSIQNPNMRDFLRDMVSICPQDFHTLFPSIEEEGITLLKQMLLFDPKKRITAAEAIKSTYFDSVRKPELEITIDTPFYLDYEYSGIDAPVSTLSSTCSSHASNTQSTSTSFFSNRSVSHSFTGRLSNLSDLFSSNTNNKLNSLHETQLNTSESNANAVHKEGNMNSKLMENSQISSNYPKRMNEKQRRKTDEQYLKYYKQLIADEVESFINENGIEECQSDKKKKRKHSKKCTIM